MNSENGKTQITAKQKQLKQKSKMEILEFQQERPLPVNKFLNYIYFNTCTSGFFNKLHFKIRSHEIIPVFPTPEVPKSSTLNDLSSLSLIRKFIWLRFLTILGREGFGSVGNSGWVRIRVGFGESLVRFLCFRFSIKMTIKRVFEMTCLKLNFKSSNR